MGFRLEIGSMAKGDMVMLMNYLGPSFLCDGCCMQ